MLFNEVMREIAARDVQLGAGLVVEVGVAGEVTSDVEYAWARIADIAVDLVAGVDGAGARNAAVDDAGRGIGIERTCCQR